MTTTRETMTAIEVLREGRGRELMHDGLCGTETPRRARYLRRCTKMHGAARPRSLTRARSEKAAHFFGLGQE